MAVRKIAEIGHPILRKKAEHVSEDVLRTPSFQRLLDDLVETMHAAQGAGLAGNQIFEPVRICAVEVLDNPRYPYKPKIPLMVLVNPKLEFLTEEKFENYEGCLSVPNLRGLVRRVAKVRLTALDREGQPIDASYSGFTAGTLQHEIDHLDGRLFVDLVEDPTSLATWAMYEDHHKEKFLQTVAGIVSQYHSKFDPRE